MTFIFNNEIFHPAFFGYNNLPDSIEIENCKLIPIKTLRLKYHGTDKSGVFCVENIRSLCKFLEIQLHRPVRGFYCIEERYLKFFDSLYQFYKKEVSILPYTPCPYYYNYRGDLMICEYNWRTGETLHKKKCDREVIRNIFDIAIN